MFGRNVNGDSQESAKSAATKVGEWAAVSRLQLCQSLCPAPPA